MAVPVKMSDLQTLAASNSPAGSDAIGNSLDDFIRGLSAIIRSTNALSSASIAAASTTDLGTSDGESVIVTGSATITSFGTTASGIKREVIFSSAGSILTNSSAIVLPTASNITVLAGEVYQFRSLGSGNWRMVGPRTQLSTTDIAGLNAALALYLPLTGGTLTGSLTTPDSAVSLTVRQGASGSIAQTTNNLAGLTVRGVGTGNGAYLEFLRDSAGVYFGLDTDSVLKVGGVSMGAVANRVLHEGITAVTLPGTLTTIGGVTCASVSSGPVNSVGTTAGFTFNDRSSGQTYAWYGAANQIILFSTADSTNSNLITINAVNANITFQGVCTGPNFIATSDKTLKKNIKQAQARDDLADRLNLVTFDWRTTGLPDRGVIAQQIRDVAPEYVYTDENGKLGVDKATLALEAVIGLAARVRALEGR